MGRRMKTRMSGWGKSERICKRRRKTKELKKKRVRGGTDVKKERGIGNQIGENKNRRNCCFTRNTKLSSRLSGSCDGNYSSLETTPSL